MAEPYVSYENMRVIIQKLQQEFPKLKSHLTIEWDAMPDLISEQGTIYVYTDHIVQDNGDGTTTDIPGIKIGDGLAYLIDLPFLDDFMLQHIEDTTRHVTQAERDFWNNKNRAYMSVSDPETLILTKL